MWLFLLFLCTFSYCRTTFYTESMCIIALVITYIPTNFAVARAASMAKKRSILSIPERVVDLLPCLSVLVDQGVQWDKVNMLQCHLLMAFVWPLFLTAEWHENENKVPSQHWQGQLARPTQRRTLKHTSRQSKSGNQQVSLGLNLCVEIRFKWHSDFIFPQTSPFWFLQTGMSFTLFAFWCLALVTLSMLFSKVDFYYYVVSDRLDFQRVRGQPITWEKVFLHL